jgi:hypothetical protein
MNTRSQQEAKTTRPARVARAPRPPTRVEAGQAPATPLEVTVSRAVDQELEWYFAYAEAALRRDNVGILPSYAAASMAPTDTDDTVRWRAHGLARAVNDCLSAVPARHASVLRVTYTPRRWPRNIEQTFQALAPIVVRLALADDPWPARSSRSTLEHAVAARLSAGLAVRKKVRLVTRFEPKARRLFGSAIAAYANARARTQPSRDTRGV